MSIYKDWLSFWKTQNRCAAPLKWSMSSVCRGGFRGGTPFLQGFDPLPTQSVPPLVLFKKFYFGWPALKFFKKCPKTALFDLFFQKFSTFFWKSAPLERPTPDWANPWIFLTAPLTPMHFYFEGEQAPKKAIFRSKLFGLKKADKIFETFLKIRRPPPTPPRENPRSAPGKNGFN